jgi:hypothetical protein
MASYICLSPIVRCFQKITFDESLLPNINPVAEIYKDTNSIGALNTNYRSKVIKIIDPNNALVVLQNVIDSPKQVQLMILKF